MENSKIEWATHTFNPWIGCQRVSSGCDQCYAELIARRFGHAEWGPFAERKRTKPGNWKKPYTWQRKARANPGDRPRVFCASLADVFENRIEAQWRADLFQVIRETPALDWLLLTKRPQLMSALLPPDWGAGYENVWLGTTVENQEEAERRIPHLTAVPAVVRFLSAEPLLGPIDPNLTGIDWVIAGGESGWGRRPMDPGWVRALRDQCAATGTAFFMKQMDKVIPIPPDLMVRQFPVPRASAPTSPPALAKIAA